ncbi:hypothetical protein TNIN_488391 [Trichonephila inaurata madagascariensis]|uniref:Catalase immune-responsive domain-containing protein n=1 Tax=Trichonephila inaurata madagascariensis TaxID=2747483 RepID=A0A8X7CR32_9ARAC|nr:hypothetical protein TNIN_488391 [Trichonephila inaurata madagascariensis]
MIKKPPGPNIAGNLVEAQDFIQERAVKNFSQADPEYGRRVKEELNKLKVGAKSFQMKAVEISSGCQALYPGLHFTGGGYRSKGTVFPKCSTDKIFN